MRNTISAGRILQIFDLKQKIENDMPNVITILY